MQSPDQSLFVLTLIFATHVQKPLGGLVRQRPCRYILLPDDGPVIGQPDGIVRHESPILGPDRVDHIQRGDRGERWNDRPRLRGALDRS